MKLSSDHSFHFNLLRWLGGAPYLGSDIAELLDVASRIIPGDFESWYSEFYALAVNVENQTGYGPPSPTTIRDRAFRAASYYRAADFYLRGDRNDKRAITLWEAATNAFNLAISHLSIPAIRWEIKADGFSVPAIYYRASNDNQPRPTILMFNGFDGSQEELFHMCGLAALERGFNVVTLEGPGQPTVIRNQKIGFRHDWENVVSPVIDFCKDVDGIDCQRLGMIGVSFGGYLAPRVIAFEKRIKATVVIDGLFDTFDTIRTQLGPALSLLVESGDAERANTEIYKAMETNTGLRWFIQQGMWAFKKDSPYDFAISTKAYSLENIVENITTPVLVCHAPVDQFNPGQAKQLADSLRELATSKIFTEKESAAGHSHPGACKFLNMVVLDWLLEKL